MILTRRTTVDGRVSEEDGSPQAQRSRVRETSTVRLGAISSHRGEAPGAKLGGRGVGGEAGMTLHENGGELGEIGGERSNVAFLYSPYALNL